MDNIGLNVTTIRLPQKPQFPKLVEQLIHACHVFRQLKNKPSTKAEAERFLHCHTLIEGLYQTWCCQSTKARLDVFLSPQYYHSKEFGKINNLTQYYVVETVSALEQLGWVEVVVGRRVTTTDTLPTQLKAIASLEKIFAEYSLRWSPLQIPKDGIVLRDYDRASKEKFKLRVAQTSAVRKMNVNVRRINEHLNKQAMCLHVSNQNLKKLIRRMSTPKYRSHWHQTVPEKQGRVLNFNHVCLRRVFSRGSMERGGRFYGGWWQFIPSEFREFITINGLATVEIDFSELHPRLLYMSQNLALSTTLHHHPVDTLLEPVLAAPSDAFHLYCYQLARIPAINQQHSKSERP